MDHFTVTKVKLQQWLVALKMISRNILVYAVNTFFHGVLLTSHLWTLAGALLLPKKEKLIEAKELKNANQSHIPSLFHRLNIHVAHLHVQL